MLARTAFGVDAAADPEWWRRCGAVMTGVATPSAHCLALELQEKLVVGKCTGFLALPGVGKIDWNTVIALADTLLALIWPAIAATYRERLFDRIARDDGLGTSDRTALSSTSNYGALLTVRGSDGWKHERPRNGRWKVMSSLRSERPRIITPIGLFLTGVGRSPRSLRWKPTSSTNSGVCGIGMVHLCVQYWRFKNRSKRSVDGQCFELGETSSPGGA